MKLPSVRPRIRKNQVWQRKAGEKKCILITGRANGTTFHTARLDNRKIIHHIREKDLYLYYELVDKNSR